MTRTYWAVFTLCDKDKNPGDKAIPVFESKQAAEKFAKGKYDVKPIEHVETTAKN
jgi:hypothetical protein